jgi:hypothetical protein
MSNKKAQCSRSVAAKEDRKSVWTDLNEHKVALLVGVLSLTGVLAVAVLSSTGSVIVATIANWDKLRDSSSTQAAPDATGDLLAYNEQRRSLVEDGFDQALDNLQVFEGQTTGEEAKPIQGVIVSIRETKEAISKQYAKMLQAIRKKQLLQADIIKTEMNTQIAAAQKQYDGLRIVSSRAVLVPEDIALMGGKIPPGTYRFELKGKRQTLTLGSPTAVEDVLNFMDKRPKAPLPKLTLPMGRNQGVLSTFIATQLRKDLDLKGPLPVTQDQNY